MIKRCPFCGSARIIEAPSEDFCLSCESFSNTINDRNSQTVFDRITASPEVLAEKLVYIWVSSWEDEFYCSTVCDGLFETKDEAIAATLERLKEVCSD